MIGLTMKFIFQHLTYLIRVLAAGNELSHNKKQNYVSLTIISGCSTAEIIAVAQTQVQVQIIDLQKCYPQFF
jgi:hypothetical protein